LRIVTSEEFRAKELNKIMSRGKADYAKVLSDVKEIIKNVRETGDRALLDYTERFDHVSLTKPVLRVSDNEVMEAYKKIPKEYVNALKRAAENIERFHRQQVTPLLSMSIDEGVTIGQAVRPLSSVGVYTPGGRACYPSSVLMCTIPAKVVGVKKIILCSPPSREGTVNPTILVAADLVGVNEVYRVGGAQAVAAMAYGTETIPKVDKIVGPGNIYVMAAKQEVSRDVAIDLPAGPSEVLIIADETADAPVIASDLIAQAEHDPQTMVILLTTSDSLASSVAEEVSNQVRSLSRREIILVSLQANGLIVVVKDVTEEIEYANLIAPEHMEIQTRNPHSVFDRIQNAGAIFLGRYSPVAFGDYSAGLNHVLPTGGYAKIYSGLSANDFIKRVNFLEASKEGFSKLKDTTMTLAKMEGLDGHAKSVTIRAETKETGKPKAARGRR